MILLLGASGYLGSAFASELRRRGHSFIPLTRTAFDYTRFDYLFDYLRTMKPEFLINAAGYMSRKGEDDIETSRDQTMLANALLPQMIARVCLMTKTPWGHISTGSIYTGAKIIEDGAARIERDLSKPGVRELFESHPDRFRGFTELDKPNFSFHSSPCSFYSGTKALAEEAIVDIGQSYIWRPRLPFNDREDPRNHLWRLQSESRVCDTIDSLSHLEDCVRACLDLWETRAPYGIYNVTNPGAATTRQLAQLLQLGLKSPHPFEYWTGEQSIARAGGRSPQSHCILDSSKLLSAGVKMRPLNEALDDVLFKIRAAARAARSINPPSPLPPSAHPPN